MEGGGRGGVRGGCKLDGGAALGADGRIEDK